MRYLLAPLLILIAVFTSCSRSSDDENEDPAVIKTLILSEYSATEENGIITKGICKYKISYQYDAKGHLLEQIDQDIKNDVEYKYSHLYDEAGNKIESNQTVKNFPGIKIIYEYDLKGFLVKESLYGANGDFVLRYEYTNDENGNQVVNDYYNAGESLSSRFIYAYDSKNNMTEMKYHSPVNFLSWRKTFEYDLQGNMTAEFVYDTPGNLSNKFLYAYDGKGNLTEQKNYGMNDDLFLTQTFVYSQFDRAGNWTLRNNFRNGAVIAVYEREIEYF